jgi:predicted glycosyltransferase
MDTVLVCPLDWGIGHATRCVPVIRKLLDNGFRVVIAADGRPYEFLRKEFPGVRIVRFRGTKITYQKNIFLALKLALLLPKFISGIFTEHRGIRKIAENEKAKIIISDNRYGLWCKGKKTIFITHQVNIIFPPPIRFLSGLLNRANHFLLEKFDELWIPDFELHQGLAGELSHPPVMPGRCSYIGSLSRFSFAGPSKSEGQPEKFDLLVALSGPEPQRTIFEEKILSQLKSTNFKGFVIRGITENDTVYDLNENIRVFSHLGTPALRELMSQSQIIICRSGYSSIMDIVTVGKRAIFVPTPGQTEQEYLARYMMDKKIYFSMSQRNFDIFYAIEMAINFPGMVLQNDYRVLEERIRTLKS